MTCNLMRRNTKIAQYYQNIPKVADVHNNLKLQLDLIQ